MTIKVNNCRDCIFRQSDFEPNTSENDTIDTCQLIRHKANYITNGKIEFIACYNSFDENGEEYFPEVLNKRLPNCPLDKEQIIVTL